MSHVGVPAVTIVCAARRLSVIVGFPALFNESGWWAREFVGVVPAPLVPALPVIVLTPQIQIRSAP
jgi:hypothetical protein